MVPSKAEGLGTPSEPEEELRAKILAYLQSHHAMTIASCQKDLPWAAAVFYVSDGYSLYLFSNPRSRHGMNMAANAEVSVAIHEDYRHWKEIKGIQLEGRAERVRSPKTKLRFWTIYREKFPFVDEFFRPGSLHETVKSKLGGIRVYRIVPRTIWYLDNSRRFGYREMLQLSRSDFTF